MAVWPSFAALAVLAFIGPVLAQNSPVMMPGVNSSSSAENRTVEGIGTPSIVMTDDMDFDKMPVAANDSGSGIAARFGKEGTEVELPQATCRPEEKTVVLDIVPELNVVYIPSCVRLHRCGGCCIGSMFKCRPKKTEAISIKVMRMSSSPPPRTRASGLGRGRERPGSSGRAASTRRSRQNATEIITVPEEQHIECACLCRIQEQDCNPALQEYVPDNCRCQCLNSDEEKKCAAQPMTHYWDDDQCTCLCLKTVNCSLTLRFDRTNCSDEEKKCAAQPMTHYWDDDQCTCFSLNNVNSSLTLRFDHTTCSCVQIPHILTRGYPNEGSAVNPRAGFVGENAMDEGSERFRRDLMPVTFGVHGRRAGREAGAGEQPPHA